MKRISKEKKPVYLLNPFTGIVEESTYAKVIGYMGTNYYTTLFKRAKEGLLLPKLGVYVFNEKPERKIIRNIMTNHVVEDEIFIQFENSKYSVSQYGRVKTTSNTGKESYLIQSKVHDNGLIARMNFGNGVKLVKVSRLVATLFVENSDPINNTCVIHLDGNTLRNISTNLRWVTKSEASKLGSIRRNTVIPVLKICPETGDVLEDYTSCAEAGRDNYLHKETISGCIRKGSYMAGGFIWKVDTEFMQS